jgi:hypothetical protein
MATGNLVLWMELHEIYLDRVKMSSNSARVCVTRARRGADEPRDGHAFKSLCFATRAHRFAAAQWRERARGLGLAVLTVINGACAK